MGRPEPLLKVSTRPPDAPNSPHVPPTHTARSVPSPGRAQRPPHPWEAAPRCGRPKLSGATKNGCACRVRSHQHPSVPCPLPNAGPWRLRSVHCGGQPGKPRLGSPPRPAVFPCSCPESPLPAVFCRMKSLEQDALRAQMVLSRSQEGRGVRGPLERLAEAPSPAPTPSPTPLEGPWVRAGAGGQPAAWAASNARFLSP